MSQLRARIGEFLELGDADGARAWLAEAAGVGPARPHMIVDYIACGTGGARRDADPRHAGASSGSSTTPAACSSSSTRRYGGRINRAFGLALRKKFCRTFDFELQAAASDDAIVLSLGPHHSFPLDEVARYVTSRTVEETLQQAVLDAPMFISRWRWNLNRSLLVLRFRGGRRNPPPIQRMEADDLMAAMFPQAAACQDNRVGPVEIPDNVIVRQTIDDTLHEGLDVDGLRALLERMETGRVRVHTVDTTEPSVLAHEILTVEAVHVPRRRGSRRTAARTRCRSAAGLSVELADDRPPRRRRDRRRARGDHAATRDERRPPRSPVLARH